jgi:hypothetical protein
MPHNDELQLFQCARDSPNVHCQPDDIVAFDGSRLVAATVFALIRYCALKARRPQWVNLMAP